MSLSRTVLVDPSLSPTGNGISWDEFKLVAFPSCHPQGYIHSDHKGGWFCSICTDPRVVAMRPAGLAVGSSVCHLSHPEETLKAWVSDWTGIAVADLTVTVTP